MPEVLSQRKDDVLIGTFTSQKFLEDTLIAQVRRELLDMADRAEGKMLLDFQGVTFMASSMIGPASTPKRFSNSRVHNSGEVAGL